MTLRILLLAAAAVLLAPAAALADYGHVVAPGETLTSVAAADGLSIAQLAAANGLSPGSELVAGSTVEIPPQDGLAPTEAVASDTPEATSDAKQPATSDAPTAAGGYVVAPGDTLSAIAARAGLSVAELAAENGLDPNGVLEAGVTLSPGGGQATSAPAPVASTTGDTSVGPPYPTAERLTASQVGSDAADAGASAPLAEAVGWQESGYNNDVVSPTGAVGVMQIEPGTWSYINSILTPGSPLDPSSAADNVRAGALYLRSLEAQTGSEQLAAASYYQGLASVRRYGLFPSTEQYVNDVMSLQAGG
jgi:LysM repeat protein